MSDFALRRRSLRDELAFLLDSTVDLPSSAYDRDTLLMRLEAAVLAREEPLREAVEARDKMLVAYRTGSRPSERTLAQMERTKNVLAEPPQGGA